ncbi:lamin tail domain-containing protein [Olivibacter domesticus]|uniref:Lamin Tail Domain n=1 Tax=Olivibacter domesticus TaxID=407022 RepID=A0A1H7STI8_OLID1|nr:lamin tail domain-containing protein [Olivibacter domesticus]SEL75254.1 Lamin Tail Domain [Olivibacter domesticus]
MTKVHYFLLIPLLFFFQDANAVKPNALTDNRKDTLKKLLPDDTTNASVIELFRAPQLSHLWKGSREKFEIKNQRLQITGAYLSPIALSHPNVQIDNTLWEIGLEVETALSVQNNIKVFLTADKQHLLTDHNGYHLQIDGSQNQHTYQIWQQSGTIRRSVFRSRPLENKDEFFRAKVRITHDKLGYWKIYTDEDNNGKFTVLTSSEGDSAVYNRTYRSSHYAGFLINYSATNQQKFSIHYFMIKPLEKNPTDGESPLPRTPQPGDILINEILPNPKTGSATFVEIYNNSDKEYDLQDLQLARILAPDSIRSTHIISNEFTTISPKEYIVLTRDPSLIQQAYHTPNSNAFIEMSSMPQMNNKDGIIALISNKIIIDRLDYEETMHHPFIKNPKGVSLERRSFEEKTNAPGNFTSAAATVGYATPGYKNSQYAPSTPHQNDVWLNSKTFSPDHDGFEDYLHINYHFNTSGIMANAYIYNEQGRVVRHLYRNHSLSTEGELLWDGLNDQGQALPLGIYIVYFEVYNAIDSVKRYRLSCVLSAKF